MFSWLKKFRSKPQPVERQPEIPVDWRTAGIEPQGNPGRGPSLNVAFASARRSWEERIRLPDLLVEALESAGLTTEFSGNSVRLAESGLILSPAIVSFKPLDEGQGTTSCTVVAARHPHVFEEVFEYQHSVGDTMRESVLKGFSAWIELDLPVLLDALRETPETCQTLTMRFPDQKNSKLGRYRRILLGPVYHIAPPPVTAGPEQDAEGEENHPGGCSCCRFTTLLPALKPLLEGHGFCAVRAFAMRNADGETDADCRVNGEDFQAGATALMEYARKWADSGFRTEKQLIVIQEWSPPDS